MRILIASFIGFSLLVSGCGTEESEPTKPAATIVEIPFIAVDRPVDECSNEELIRMLADEDWQVRCDASDALLLNVDEAYPLLIESLDHENAFVRAGVVFTLAATGARASDSLKRMHELRDSDPHELVRSAAAFAIDSLPSQQASLESSP